MRYFQYVGGFCGVGSIVGSLEQTALAGESGTAPPGIDTVVMEEGVSSYRLVVAAR